MTFKRTAFEWEVKLQSPDGQELTEKVQSYWSPTFEGVKESIVAAARCKAWTRNKKKVNFVAINEPTLIGPVEAVA